jgi:DNA-directed RNA polymerase specialized sigma24 family protein
LSDTHKIPDEQLVKLLSTPGSEWEGVLYDNYAAVLYGVIYRIVRSEPAAEQILYEAFQKIKENIQHYDVAHGKLFLWMINICRALALNSELKKENVPAHSISVMRGISYRLETDYKVLIDLLFVQGYSQVEVAEELNIPLGTVKARSRAAIQKLRTLMQTDSKSEWTLKST